MCWIMIDDRARARMRREKRARDAGVYVDGWIGDWVGWGNLEDVGSMRWYDPRGRGRAVR